VAPIFHSLQANWGLDVLMQEFVESDDEYSVAGLGDGKGNVVAFCSIRKVALTTTGKTFCGIVIRNPELQAATARIIAALKWFGIFEMEFVKGQDDYTLIEFNPRATAWIDFPSQIGCNIPAMLIDLLRDHPIPPVKECEPGKLFVRHNIDVVGDISQVAKMMKHGEMDVSATDDVARTSPRRLRSA
jgi:carbamoyl-phosphate synthase large subunit